jgi:starch-binding outer membrane protein, SusD/RagB family
MKTTSRHPLLSGSALLIFSAVTLYGCKDFLEEAANPQGTLNQLTLANRAGVEGSLIAAYRALEWNNGVGGDWGNSVSNWVWGSVTSDDAYKGSEATDQPSINDIEAYQWSTPGTENYLNQKWRGVYEGINRANSTLRLLKEVSKKAGELTTLQQTSIEGEALFLRAHFHFEGFRMWGNIPIYTEDDTDFREANADTVAVAAQILKDLDSAIKLLPVNGPRDGQKGRVYHWTAKAYKGRVQAYTRDWAGALTTLRDVQASGKYALEASYDRVYTGIASASNGPETILAYQASANDGAQDGNNANYGERLNYPHSGSPFGCCGFHQPSQNFVNYFQVDAAGLPLALSSPGTWNARNDNLTADASATMRLDPRLDWTVGRDGVPFKDWGLHEAGWIRAPGYGGPYSGKKHTYEDASNAESTIGWVPTQLSSVNMHIFRYADLLLLLAEAEVEAGSLENARTIVNQIRTRAGVTAQGCGLSSVVARANAAVAKYPACAGDTRMAVPINDPSIKWADYEIGLYTAPWADKNVAREAVRAERRLELGFEGQRFFDLRRYGTFQTVLNNYVTVEKTRRPHLTSAAAVEPRHRFFPLPNVQVELSKVGGTARLKQNPGW